MFKRHILAATGVLAAGMMAVATADDQKSSAQTQGQTQKKASLAGTYTILSGERDGNAIPPAEIEGATVVVTPTKIMGTDKDKKEFFSATYTLDATKTPAAIAMTSSMPDKGGKMKEISTTGLVKWDMDKVTIVYALPDGDTPTEFKAGKGQHLFVMRIKQ
jgi:uncharacterized protein (TIGR03067 family)